jgi:hypothetical protein
MSTPAATRERLERIKALVGQDYGTAAISTADIRWLIEQVVAVPDGFVPVPVEIVEFLLGTKPHPCGLWFGDARFSRTGWRVGYWWREDLEKALAAAKPAGGDHPRQLAERQDAERGNFRR